VGVADPIETRFSFTYVNCAIFRHSRSNHTSVIITRHVTKCGAGRMCGADLNGDNLRISTVYLRISDHCRVTVWVWVRVGVRVRIRV